MLQIALASQSPRRRELLRGAGYSCRVFPVKVSEIIDENLNPAEQVIALAKRKAEACLEQYKDLKVRDFLILGADTLVVIEGHVLGKPLNFSEAEQSLRLLSGKTHSVITGFCLYHAQSTKLWSGVEETRVTFRQIGGEEIRAYIVGGEPMDKAGAYAIQGEGGKFVSSYSGSWSNVVGLPLERLERALKENGWIVGRLATAKY